MDWIIILRFENDFCDRGVVLAYVCIEAGTNKFDRAEWRHETNGFR